MKRFVALFFILSISSFSFGIGSHFKEPSSTPSGSSFRSESEINININGQDNNIAKHIKILDSIVNFNNAKIISKNIQIDSTNTLINYNIRFLYKLIYKDNQDNMINFIKNEFKGLQVGFNQSAGFSGPSDSVRVLYYANLVTKEYNNIQKDRSMKTMREQQYPILILIVVISVALMVIITLTLLLVKLILRK